MPRSLVLALATALALAAAPGTPSPAAPTPPALLPVAGSAPTGVWPLVPDPEVVEHFAPPSAAWQAGHRGVDLAGSPGQDVRAAAAGHIGFAGSIGGKPVVTVIHGGTRTTYEPVVALARRGQEVAAGEPIGRLVTVGSHCFPDTCLHWGLREGEQYLDPLSLVGGTRVRLLPLWRTEPAPASRTRGERATPLEHWRSPLAAWGGRRSGPQARG